MGPMRMLQPCSAIAFSAAKPVREVLTRLSFMVLWLIISRSFLLLVLSDRICSCFCGVLLFKLAVIKGGVNAFLCQQLLMTALFDDIAVLHKQDDVRVPDGGKAVGAPKPAKIRVSCTAWPIPPVFYSGHGSSAGWLRSRVQRRSSSAETGIRAISSPLTRRTMK